MKSLLISIKSPFSAIYHDWSKVPVKGNQYKSINMAKIALLRAEIENNINKNNFVPYKINEYYSILGLMAATSPEPLRILDWGGSVGFTYMTVKYAALNRYNEYTIVEYPKIIEAAKVLFPEIKYEIKIPDKYFDIIHIGTALQYVEDYLLLIKELIKNQQNI